MSSLEEVYREESKPRRALLWGLALLVGGFVCAVGFVFTTASLVAGFGLSRPVALKVAVALAGGALAVGYLACFARATVTGRRWNVAAVGTVVAVAGLALFWTALPAGWTGDPSAVPTTAVVVYASGLLAVFGAVLAVAAGDESDAPTDAAPGETDAIGGVGSAVSADRDDRAPSSAAADGGSDESDLTFFDGE